MFINDFTVVLVCFLVYIPPSLSSSKVSPILFLQVVAVFQVLQVLQVHWVEAQGCLKDVDCLPLSHYCFLKMLGMLHGWELLRVELLGL